MQRLALELNLCVELDGCGGEWRGGVDEGGRAGRGATGELGEEYRVSFDGDEHERQNLVYTHIYTHILSLSFSVSLSLSLCLSLSHTHTRM